MHLSIIFEPLTIVLEKLKGKVIKSTGSWYKVLTPDNQIYDCRIKGKFRLEGSKSTNIIAVGDIVYFHYDKQLNSSVIDEIEERKNFLVRKSAKLSKQSQIIASNLDYVCIILSMYKPRISSAFIDRFLVIAEAYEVEPVLVFNKLDLYRDKDMEKLAEWVELYESLGYKTLFMSAIDENKPEQLFEILKGKTSLFAGQSGVGKSTILNRLNADLDLKTTEISTFNDRGKHTTTFYEMHPIDEDTFVIDSPGIRELGLFDFEAYEIGLFFPEIKEKALDCKFSTCLHLEEPKCAVVDAVMNGEIHPQRYENYLKLIDGFER